jgi:uncharacterized protein (DUF2147 family)
MKQLILSALAAILSVGMAVADPLEGTWRTAPDDNGNSGLVVVTPCDDALCGTLTTAYDSSGEVMQSPNIGRLIIWDTQAQGTGEYRGRVYSPDRDRTYNSRLMLTGDSLSVSGCVLGICRHGGTWTRVN